VRLCAGADATIRALYTALRQCLPQRDDVAKALLTLTPLYRYVTNDSSDQHAARDLVLQGHQGHGQRGQGPGHQRPVSSSMV